MAELVNPPAVARRFGETQPRLGGNSLSDLLVFGRRASLAAAHHAELRSLLAEEKGETARRA